MSSWVYFSDMFAFFDLQHFAVMWDHILQLEKYNCDGDVVDESQLSSTSLQLPKS